MAEAEVRKLSTGFFFEFPLCWFPCRDRAGAPDSFHTYRVYTDDITMQLVAEASKLLGESVNFLGVKEQKHLIRFREAERYKCVVLRSGWSGEEPREVLRQFGGYFFEFCKSSGYFHMLRTLGGNLCEFVENLDALHSFLGISYKVQPALPFSFWFPPIPSFSSLLAPFRT